MDVDSCFYCSLVAGRNNIFTDGKEILTYNYLLSNKKYCLNKDFLILEMNTFIL